MNLSRQILGLALASLLVIGTGGCVKGKAFSEGRSAELRGDAGRAYDNYCRAAASHQTHPSIADSIERTAPAAAAEAERAAITAMDAGHYDEAWRMWMRALEIRPADHEAIEMIKKIERDHPTEIACVKADWQARGHVTLALAPAVKPPVAAARKPRESAAEDDQSAFAAAEPTDDDLERNVAPRFDKSDRPVPPETQSRSDDPAKSTASNRRVVTAAPTPTPQYVVVFTVSRRDRRYPRVHLAIDEVNVRIEDTEDDPEVDLDLLIGKKRIKKIRDMESGATQTFRGASGAMYRLTVLGIHHKSHTARIGIRPM